MGMTPAQTLLWRIAAQTRGRTIGLYGGSFNPAHDGHAYIAREALKRLALNEIWLMVSPGNPLKDATHMAPFEKRYASTVQKIGHHPRIKISALEKTLGTVYTADTVQILAKSLPQTRFIWVMGADNLASFHHWKNWHTIVTTLPIAVFDRPGYSLDGLTSDLARHYRKFRTSSHTLMSTIAPAWTFLATPRHTGSATTIRKQLGSQWPAGKQGKET